jgi:TIR domain
VIDTPLQIVLSWRSGKGASGDEWPVLVEAVARAFVGRSPVGDSGFGATPIPNWVAGDAIKPLELKRFSETPKGSVRALLNSGRHTLVIVWIDEAAIQSDEFICWLGKVWEAAERSNRRHGVLLATVDERLRDDFLQQASSLGVGALRDCQILSWEQLGERAARPAAVALIALEKARELLCRGMRKPRQKLSLFISHAKHDGLSLAQTLSRAVRNMPSLDDFYDARDIMPGNNWQAELQQAVESSVFIAVRTDGYDERPWCVQEVEWAEIAGVPIIVVEARSSLFHHPSRSRLEDAPWVRIPDGSLTRILYSALRENLKLLVVQRGVRQLGAKIYRASVVLPRAPTLGSLDRALKRIAKSNTKDSFIVYPDPKLQPEMDEAVGNFVAARSKNTQVLNYTDLLAFTGGRP